MVIRNVYCSTDQYNSVAVCLYSQHIFGFFPSADECKLEEQIYTFYFVACKAEIGKNGSKKHHSAAEEPPCLNEKHNLRSPGSTCLHCTFRGCSSGDCPMVEEIF